MEHKRHKKEVEICGEIIEVDYFELYTDYGESKFKISDIWYNITMPFYTIKRKIKDTYWDVRYAFQRMFLDYDSVDIFSTYSRFVDRYYKILTRYRKNQWGHPGTMTEEEWNKIVDDMIFHLYWMDENNVEEELRKDIPDNWYPCLSVTQEIMDKHKDEFFKLFCS